MPVLKTLPLPFAMKKEMKTNVKKYWSVFFCQKFFDLHVVAELVSTQCLLDWNKQTKIRENQIWTVGRMRQYLSTHFNGFLRQLDSVRTGIILEQSRLGHITLSAYHALAISRLFFRIRDAFFSLLALLCSQINWRHLLNWSVRMLSSINDVRLFFNLSTFIMEWKSI